MIEGGQVYLRAWVDGVQRHAPGSGQARSWVDMPAWERASTTAVYEMVRAFVEAGGTDRLSRVQKGQFVHLCWLAQVHKHLDSPTTADWDALPTWHQETNTDVFDHIEDLILGRH
ncbi:hypothetical protein [Actinokineospora globicatena]|uniref:Uncharacterized protein n=1 Tax=Actinokineospora globicatena TaxID=103729 RepID=A0A9W6VBG2_9PSEU|nr:hypothetical protein [Actinokineospora globicatena]GLW92943.1 hypothetical protein Aglo03_37590 [Actinokineospora globicatena]